jgi:exopolysaccharide production protein ExoQ
MTQSSSTPPWRLDSGAVLAAAALVMASLAVLAPLALAPLQAVLALVLLALAPRRVFAGISSVLPIAVLVAALALWATASALWSILPRHSLFEGLRFFVVGAGGLIVLGAALDLPPLAGKRIAQFAAAGVSLAILLLVFERFGNFSITRLLHGVGTDYPFLFSRYDRGVTTLVLLLWPALIASRRIWQGAILMIGVFVAAWVMASLASLLGLGAGVAAFAFAYRFPRFVAAALITSMLAATVVLPAVLPSDQSVVTFQERAPWFKSSGIHRLLIWRFTADRIAERPFLGWGMDSSRELPGGHRDFAATLPGINLHPGDEALPLHPHNAALQWRVELGLPGTVLCVAIVFWILWRVGFTAHLLPVQRAAMLGFAATAMVIGLLSFGAWQAWWLSCLWTISALCAGATVEKVQP